MAVAANLPWLVSLWRFRGIRTGSGLFMTTDSPRFLVDYFLASRRSRAGPALVLLVLGTGAGWSAWWFERSGAGGVGVRRVDRRADRS